jgi:RHS repeat-associated protein
MNIICKVRYKFTGKERDAETGLDYFGSRYYDSDLSIWLSVDPLSDARPNLSPYHYCQWNPMVRRDPSGAWDDNYTVDEDGNIKLQERTNDRFDRIYTKESWESGAKDKYIQVEKGVIGKQFKGKLISYDFINEEVKAEYIIDFITLKGDEEAKEIFKFMADHTNVEWGLTFVGLKKNQMSILSTSHVVDAEAGIGYLFYTNYTIRGHIHNHPSGNLDPSEEDRKSSKIINQKFPSAKFYLYSSGGYVEYDENGIIPKVDIIGSRKY